MQRAGERTTLITFHRFGTSENDYGEPVKSDTPTVLGRALAKVFYGRGDERRRAAAEGATIAATFAVPATTTTRSITTEDQIFFGGPWDIEGIVPRGMHEIEFTAVRRQS